MLDHVNYWWLVPDWYLGNVVVTRARGCRWRMLLSDRGTPDGDFWAQSIGCLLTDVFPRGPARRDGW